MRAGDIPWRDGAALVRELGSGDREIAAEGSLQAMVTEVAKFDQSAWWRYRIVMPDRALSPFEFDDESFSYLLSELRTA